MSVVIFVIIFFYITAAITPPTLMDWLQCTRILSSFFSAQHLGFCGWLFVSIAHCDCVKFAAAPVESSDFCLYQPNVPSLIFSYCIFLCFFFLSSSLSYWHSDIFANLFWHLSVRFLEGVSARMLFVATQVACASKKRTALIDMQLSPNSLCFLNRT